MKKQEFDRIRESVRNHYGKIASGTSAGCQCCGSEQTGTISGLTDDRIGRSIGYSDEQLKCVPKGANLGLGCGNPQAIAGLQPGETVLDLGSGAGFDCFLAAASVGDTGKVIGVDMTSEMIAKARANAVTAGVKNVEFRLGEIEHLPVPNDSVDVIISNCVVNLSPDKPDVFKDAHRVLKPGGRLAISDIVALKPLPEQVRRNLSLIAGCVGGAALIDDLERMLRSAGFVDIRIEPLNQSRRVIRDWFPEHQLENYVASATIEARKSTGTVSK